MIRVSGLCVLGWFVYSLCVLYRVCVIACEHEFFIDDTRGAIDAHMPFMCRVVGSYLDLWLSLRVCGPLAYSVTSIFIGTYF